MTSISKSKYLSGLQCHKRLWYEVNAKAEVPPPDAQTQAIFDAGDAVGALAKKLYPGGIEIEWVEGENRNLALGLKQSQELIKKRVPLFEAGFAYGGALAIADLLLPVLKDQWDVIEVKSSAEVKEHNYDDAALQLYVYRNTGLKIRDVYLMHVNNQYIKHGEIDPKKFFTKVNINAEVAEAIKHVPQKLKEMHATLKLKSAPKIKIGPHCSHPYACPMTTTCWAFLPEHNVFDLYCDRGGKKASMLMDAGITSLADIPTDFKLTDNQKVQFRAATQGRPQVNKTGIREFLKSIRYPACFLDFETIFPAIPVIDGTRPFQQIPFQYSLHVLAKAGAKPEHHEFLYDGSDDPRPELMKKLFECLDGRGSVLAFNKPFESARLKEAAELLPQYAKWVEDVLKRMLDLIVPFRNFDYYHPDQGGSCSIKNVLPALTPMRYDNLEIAEGGAASREYLRTHYLGEASDKKAVRKNLLAYCKQDTEAMVALLKALEKLAV